MSEVIRLNKDIYPHILLAQSDSGKYYLLDQTKETGFSPEPPIILSYMPSFYTGHFLFFIYNGHHRLYFADNHNFSLNGLVVTSEAEIPKPENHGGSLAQALLNGLSHTLLGHYYMYQESKEFNDVGSMIKELEIRERFGLTIPIE